jgi:hypothetical protein
LSSSSAVAAASFAAFVAAFVAAFSAFAVAFAAFASAFAVSSSVTSVVRLDLIKRFHEEKLRTSGIVCSIRSIISNVRSIVGDIYSRIRSDQEHDLPGKKKLETTHK